MKFWDCQIGFSCGWKNIQKKPHAYYLVRNCLFYFLRLTILSKHMSFVRLGIRSDPDTLMIDEVLGAVLTRIAVDIPLPVQRHVLVAYNNRDTFTDKVVVVDWPVGRGGAALLAGSEVARLVEEGILVFMEFLEVWEALPGLKSYCCRLDPVTFRLPLLDNGRADEPPPDRAMRHLLGLLPRPRNASIWCLMARALYAASPGYLVLFTEFAQRFMKKRDARRRCERQWRRIEVRSLVGHHPSHGAGSGRWPRLTTPMLQRRGAATTDTYHRLADPSTTSLECPSLLRLDGKRRRCGAESEREKYKKTTYEGGKEFFTVTNTISVYSSTNTHTHTHTTSGVE